MTTNPDIEVFFDGDCPLCMKEIRFLQRRDKNHLIGFTDIAEPGFDASQYGMTHDDFMDKIRGRLSDGTLIEGVEVFRRLYTAIGLGFLVSITRIPGISHALDLGYRLFAKNRLRLTGRCKTDSCAVPGDRAPSSKAST